MWAHFFLVPIESCAQEAELGVDAVMLGMWESGTGQRQTSTSKEGVEKERPPKEVRGKVSVRPQGRPRLGPGPLLPIDLKVFGWTNVPFTGPPPGHILPLDMLTGTKG